MMITIIIMMMIMMMTIIIITIVKIKINNNKKNNSIDIIKTINLINLITEPTMMIKLTTVCLSIIFLPFQGYTYIL